MKVIICGGRDYTDYNTLTRALNNIHTMVTITHVITGAARGADTLGYRWAVSKGIPNIDLVPADWSIYGKRAGYLRNVKMADMHPNAVICFPGGRGTQMMKDIATQRDIAVFEALEFIWD